MATLIQILFALVSALVIGAAVMSVTVRNVIHSALWLIASFFGVGALYLLLEAEFIAVVQVLVYVGAISILILFAIMLTRQVTGEGVRQLTERWWLALLVAALLFAAVITPTLFNHQWNVPLPTGPPGTPEPVAGVAELGAGFVIDFLLQFEVAGVLLTVALIGAIVIAFEERVRRKKVLTLAEEHALRKHMATRNAPEQPSGETAPAPAPAKLSD
ncbi:MAG: NADH-quinone oxidoreductase subunit J [Oscillochloris sp.]|nr:NADH-quinone oxidoreductase subunit J [Oscillochloris sp.]